MSKLKVPKGRVLLKVDTEFKNNYDIKGEDGKKVTLRLERDVQNLNRREVSPVEGICLHSDYIPENAIVVIHHNSAHPTNEIFDHEELPQEEIAKGIKLYSIPESECFLWRKENETEWQPLHGFAIALRVFEPYTGTLDGIEPKLIKDTLYVKTGHYKGKVVRTIKASDYELVIRGTSGREDRIIRFRTFEKYNEREEVMYVENELTKKVKKGQLLVGLTPQNCVKLEEI